MIANSHKRIDYSPLRPSSRRASSAGGVIAAPADWRSWLHSTFPTYTTHAPAPHHAQAWDWLWGLERGVRPPPFLLILARGGAKSTTAELGCVAVAARKTRRYVLYVSDTQVQSDKHVQTISGMMERAGFERELNKYGSSKGWRRNQIRTADGFKIDAIGLDTAARGFKIDEDRPDLIVLDDVDGLHDTPLTTQKKIEALTMSILPAMATDGAVFGAQNIIHSNGVFARLADDRADFLADRIVCGPHPAIRGLDYEYRDGQYIITAGTPTWEGQSIADCQGFIKTWGLLAFLVECQHDVARAGRYYEAWRDDIHVIPPRAIPGDATVWAAFDYGFAHNTAFGVFALVDGTMYMLGEHVRNKWTVKQHAPAMDGLLGRLGIPKKRLREIVAGHDAFDSSKDSGGKSIADQYAEYGYEMTHATIDRINGWSAIRERLGNPQIGHPPTLHIFDTCPITARQLKAAVHDPKRPEDVLKVDADQDGNGGDDAIDMLRYGAMAALEPATGFVHRYDARYQPKERR
jgi:hypothetical protein